MLILYSVVAVALVVSFAANRKKTRNALKIAGKKLLKILPSLMVFIVVVSVFLFFVPEEVIAGILGDRTMLTGVLSASLVGSVAFVPGFIVFPLCGLLRSRGVSFTVLSAFTTTLMMVGILSFGVEKEILGLKLAVVRNILAFAMALLVALVTGLIFGEIPA